MSPSSWSRIEGKAPADLVLLDGNVFPVAAEAFSRAQGLAIRAGRVVGVGSSAEMRGLAGPGTMVVSLDGRTVVPGLIDSHVHLVRAGTTWEEETHWAGVPSLDRALALVAEAAGQRSAGSWIRVVGGWHPGQFEEGRGPTRHELDAVCPDHPVYVQFLYEHALLNSAGIRALGIGPGTADPPGGSFERLPDGSPTGVVRGVGAFAHCLQGMGVPARERAVVSTRSLMTTCNRFGLTGAVDAGGFGMTPESYDPLFEVRRRGELTLHLRLYLGASSGRDEVEQLHEWTTYAHPGFGDDLLRVVGAGEVIDFALHDLEGLERHEIAPATRQRFLSTSLILARRGWPMHVHAVLDDTISSVLDAWEEVDREVAVRSLRWSIAHAESISRWNLERVRDLGIGIGIHGRMVFRAADSSRVWGKDIVRTAPPVRSMVAMGIPVAAGSDATRVTPINPWLTLWWLVTGRSLDGHPPRDPSERLSRREALDLYTRGSTWLSGDESASGTLEPGKTADVAVLSDDYFTVPEDQIHQLHSVLTLVNGRPVHEEAEFEGLGDAIAPAPA